MLPASTQMSQMFQFALTINTQLIHHRQLCHPQNRVFSVKNHFGFFRVSSKKKEFPFNDCHVLFFDSFQFVGPMSRGAPTHGRSRGPAQERDRAGLSGLLEVLVSAHPCVCARACRSSSPCCSPPSLLYRRGSFWTLQRLDRAPPDAASRAAASRAACRVNPKQVVYRGSPVCVCKRACVREKEREKEREGQRVEQKRALCRLPKLAGAGAHLLAAVRVGFRHVCTTA